jgi:hypothetical protein
MLWLLTAHDQGRPGDVKREPGNHRLLSMMVKLPEIDKAPLSGFS